jgi:lipopolysaccharide export system protein LptA
MTIPLRAVVAFLFFLLASYQSDGAAQTSPLMRGEGAGLPIEIFAEDGIEWQQERSVVVARGNARAIRGDVELIADVLSAYYREAATGESQIWRVEAEGNVRIVTPSDTAYAEKGTYDVDSRVVVLQPGSRDAEPVRVVGKSGDLTAQEQMEFWEEKQMFVARGAARALQGDRTLSADVLVAYLERTAAGEDRIERVEAFEDVVVQTPRETVSADHGVYRLSDGVVSMLGAVKITRGPNQLNGCSAEVNLNTGVSKLFGCAEGSQQGRVEGLIHPREAQSDGGATPSPVAPATRR